MERGAKPTKAKAEARAFVSGKSGKIVGATDRQRLMEALEQQAATSEILRVISQSPTDVQPVFDTIAAAALKLCAASSGLVFTFDGELIQLAAIANLDPEGADAWRQSFPRPPSRDTAVTRAVLTRSVVAIPDVLDEPDYAIRATASTTGFRSALAVPLLREGKPIGAIGVGRAEPGPFPDKQVALLKTFADQAVIAIENTRLFKELGARTAQLTRSVGELKALGEVGQAVSSTLALETVLSTIVSRATQLAGTDGGSIWEYEDPGAQPGERGELADGHQRPGGVRGERITGLRSAQEVGHPAGDLSDQNEAGQHGQQVEQPLCQRWVVDRERDPSGRIDADAGRDAAHAVESRQRRGRQLLGHGRPGDEGDDQQCHREAERGDEDERGRGAQPAQPRAETVPTHDDLSDVSKDDMDIEKRYASGSRLSTPPGPVELPGSGRGRDRRQAGRPRCLSRTHGRAPAGEVRPGDIFRVTRVGVALASVSVVPVPRGTSVGPNRSRRRRRRSPRSSVRSVKSSAIAFVGSNPTPATPVLP